LKHSVLKYAGKNNALIVGLVHLQPFMQHRKILIVTNRIPYPLNDGGNIAVHAMIEGYHKAGIEVFLFSMNTSRHYIPIEELPSLFQAIRVDTFDIDTDIKIVPSLKNFLLSKQPQQADRFFDKAFEKKLLVAIDSFEPDIIQLESIYLSVYIPAIRQQSPAIIASRLHNIEHQIWERLAAVTSNTFKRFYLKDLSARIKRFESQAWKQADVLVAITEADATVIKESGITTPIHVAPLGINNDKIVYNLAQERWVGYHIGAMDWLPNAEAISWFLENVWKEIHKALPDFEFHFAGRNMPASFKKYEGDGVLCAGEVADAKTFISDKKILLVPLQAGSGIRVKVMEAIAAEKLVVSTSVGVQGIVGLQPNHHFLLAETPADFVTQLQFVFENLERAEKIAKDGAAYIKTNFCQNSITQDLLQALDKISSKR